MPRAAFGILGQTEISGVVARCALLGRERLFVDLARVYFVNHGLRQFIERLLDSLAGARRALRKQALCHRKKHKEKRLESESQPVATVLVAEDSRFRVAGRLMSTAVSGQLEKSLERGVLTVFLSEFRAIDEVHLALAGRF